MQQFFKCNAGNAKCFHSFAHCWLVVIVAVPLLLLIVLTGFRSWIFYCNNSGSVHIESFTPFITLLPQSWLSASPRTRKSLCTEGLDEYKMNQEPGPQVHRQLSEDSGPPRPVPRSLLGNALQDCAKLLWMLVDGQIAPCAEGRDCSTGRTSA